MKILEMNTPRLLLFLILFFTGSLLSTCDNGDDWDVTICSVRCPDSRPWLVNSLSASICYETKEECEASGSGSYYGCSKCNF